MRAEGFGVVHTGRHGRVSFQSHRVDTFLESGFLSDVILACDVYEMIFVDYF